MSSPGRSSLTSGSSPSLLDCASLLSYLLPLILNYISVWLLTWPMLYQVSCVPRTLKRYFSQMFSKHLLCGLANTSVASAHMEGYLEKKIWQLRVWVLMSGSLPGHGRALGRLAWGSVWTLLIYYLLSWHCGWGSIMMENGREAILLIKYTGKGGQVWWNKHRQLVIEGKGSDLVTLHAERIWRLAWEAEAPLCYQGKRHVFEIKRDHSVHPPPFL